MAAERKSRFSVSSTLEYHAKFFRLLEQIESQQCGQVDGERVIREDIVPFARDRIAGCDGDRIIGATSQLQPADYAITVQVLVVGAKIVAPTEFVDRLLHILDARRK